LKNVTAVVRAEVWRHGGVQVEIVDIQPIEDAPARDVSGAGPPDLLRAKDLDWIDPRRAAGGEERGNGCHGDQEQRPGA
jgi:hypothetical protein